MFADHSTCWLHIHLHACTHAGGHTPSHTHIHTNIFSCVSLWTAAAVDQASIDLLHQRSVRHKLQGWGIKWCVLIALLVDLVIYLYRIMSDYRTIWHAKTLGCHAVTFQRTQGLDHTPPQHTQKPFNLYPQPIPQFSWIRLNDFIKCYLISCLNQRKALIDKGRKRWTGLNPQPRFNNSDFYFSLVCWIKVWGKSQTIQTLNGPQASVLLRYFMFSCHCVVTVKAF